MNPQSYTRTQAPRWALLLLAVGLAVVVLGTAAGSQGWQAWWSAGADAVSRQIVWDIRLPRSLGAWLGGRIFDVSGSYLMAWWLSIALSVMAAALSLPVREAPLLRALGGGQQVACHAVAEGRDHE